MLRQTLQKPYLLQSHNTQSASGSSRSPATLTSNKRYGLYPILVSLQMRKCARCCVLRDAYGLPDVSPAPWYRRGNDIFRSSMGTAVQIESCRYRRLNNTSPPIKVRIRKSMERNVGKYRRGDDNPQCAHECALP